MSDEKPSNKRSHESEPTGDNANKRTKTDGAAAEPAGHWVYRADDGAEVILFRCIDDMKKHYEWNCNDDKDKSLVFDVLFKKEIETGDVKTLSAAVFRSTECYEFLTFHSGSFEEDS